MRRTTSQQEASAVLASAGQSATQCYAAPRRTSQIVVSDTAGRSGDLRLASRWMIGLPYLLGFLLSRPFIDFPTFSANNNRQLELVCALYCILTQTFCLLQYCITTRRELRTGAAGGGVPSTNRAACKAKPAAELDLCTTKLHVTTNALTCSTFTTKSRRSLRISTPYYLPTGRV